MFDPGDPVLDPWDDFARPARQWRADWARRADDAVDSLATRQGFVLTRTQCRALGYSPAQVRTLVRRKSWSAPRRGVVAVAHPLGDARVHIALSATATALLRLGSVVSHECAAILQGVPVLDLPAWPTLTIQTGRNGLHGNGYYYRAPLPASQVRRWYGCALTSVARTIIDLARLDRDSGLVAADSALHDGLVSIAELRDAVSISTGWAGNASARWVVAHADGRSDSPLESLTRSCLVVGGLPVPEPQIWIPQARARVDFLYRAERLVIEADGLLKYRSPADLREEKRRQVRLERAGYRVERVLWSDVRTDRDGTVARIRAALNRSH